MHSQGKQFVKAAGEYKTTHYYSDQRWQTMYQEWKECVGLCSNTTDKSFSSQVEYVLNVIESLTYTLNITILTEILTTCARATHRIEREQRSGSFEAVSCHLEFSQCVNCGGDNNINHFFPQWHMTDVVCCTSGL